MKVLEENKFNYKLERKYQKIKKKKLFLNNN